MVPPDSPGASPLIGRTVGNYRIVSLIGRGGMGEVYRAHDEKLDRTVAVKALPEAFVEDAQARARFVRETRLAGRVNHPFVASVYDVVEEAGSLYLVMEHIEGRTLAQILREEKPAQKEVLHYGLEIAEALRAIHDGGLVHRDLKPSNVMVERSGHVKVTDFGVARKVAPPAGSESTDVTQTVEESLTSSAEGVGTVIYMSPEQVRGAPVDHRSDLFSLGTLLYQAVTGEHPFLRNSVLETASAILHEAPGGGEEPKTLTDSGPLRQVVLRLLQKDPDLRYQETSSVVADLRAISEGRTLPRPPLAEVVRRPSVRRAASLALLATAVLVVLLVWRPWTPRPTASPSLGRILVAVLPLDDRTEEEGASWRGEMLADLLTAGLGESSKLRSLDSERVQAILEGLPSRAGRGERVQAVMRAAGVPWVVGGEIWKEGASYHGSIDLYRQGSDSPSASFPVSAQGATVPLVDQAAVKILTAVLPEGGQAEAGRVGAAGAAEVSDEARLLEFRAREAIREQRYLEAVDLLEEALEIDPRFLAAAVQLAAVLEVIGYEDRAREAADDALRLVEDPVGTPSPRLELKARIVHANLHGEVDREVELRRRLAERYRDEPRVHLGLAEALRDQGRDLEEALAEAERGSQLDPGDPRAEWLRARILTRMKRYEEAMAALDRSRTLSEAAGSRRGLAQTEFARGHVEYAQGRYREAAELFLETAALYRELGLEALAAGAERTAGDAELAAGRIESAEAHYRAALATAREAGQYRSLIRSLGGLGASLYQAGRIEAAEPLLRQAVEQARELDNPKLSMAPLLNLAHLLNYTGRTAEGEDLAREGLEAARRREHRAGEIQAQVMIADTAFQQGRLAEASSAQREIIAYQRSPSGNSAGLAYSLMSLAEVLGTQGRTGEAMAAVEEALSLGREKGQRPLIAPALLMRADLRGQLALWTEAEADLAEAERVATDEAGTLGDILPRLPLGRARLSMMRGDWEEASRQLALVRRAAADSKAVTLVVPLLVASCETALPLGEVSQGLSWCRQALESERALATDRTRARLALATALLQSGEPEEALREARRALEASREMDLLLPLAGSAALLVSLPEPPVDLEARREEGRRAMQAYLDAAPPSRREVVRGRPDLRPTLEKLGWTEGADSMKGS